MTTNQTYQLPQSLESEEYVLGSCIMVKGTLDDVVEILDTHKMIYSNEHQNVYEVLLDMRSKGKSIDVVSIIDHAQKMKYGNVTHNLLFSLCERVGSSKKAISHALIIKEKYTLRELGKLGSRLLNVAHGESDLSVCRSLGTLIFDHCTEQMLEESETFGQAVLRVSDEIGERAQNDGLIGIPTGSSEMDIALGGFRKGKFYVFAARPAMGKSMDMLMHARKAINAGHYPAIFSLEMPKDELIERILSAETRIHSYKLMQGDVGDDFYDKAMKIAEWKCEIKDMAGISILQLKNQCKKLVALGVDIIFIDYLQLLRGSKKQSREQEIAEISRELKNIAKDLDVPVIGLAQLSRAVEQRNVKKPMLSDLRESGGIEQDADVVVFLYRPFYYGLESDEEGNATVKRNKKGGIVFTTCEYLIAKNRNGKLGRIVMEAHLAISEMKEYEGEEMSYTPLEKAKSKPTPTEIDGIPF